MSEIRAVPPRDPIPKTESELKQIFAEEISKILGSNIHSSVFDRRGMSHSGITPGWTNLKFEEMEANLHMWERLGTAYEALKALKGYTGQPRGFVLDRSLPDLPNKTGWIQGKDLAEMLVADSMKVGVDLAGKDQEFTTYSTYQDQVLVQHNITKPPPLRDIVFSEPVKRQIGDEERPERYLVTLICGHKLYTDKKQAEYPCRECKETP